MLALFLLKLNLTPGAILIVLWKRNGLTERSVVADDHVEVARAEAVRRIESDAGPFAAVLRNSIAASANIFEENSSPMKDVSLYWPVLS